MAAITQVKVLPPGFYSYDGFTISENPDYMTVFEFEKIDVPYFHTQLIHYFPLVGVIAISYLIMVAVLKNFMENREPFELRKPLFFWNVLLAGLSTIMFARLLPEIVHVNNTFGFYSTYCTRDHFNSATAFWGAVYSVSKILEFGDTVFILLRKQKLTFLHVFHHTSVFLGCFWGCLRVDPASRSFAVMNCLVHSVMYTYFALKAAQIKLPRKLSMVVTSVQLLQFATAILINILAVYAIVMGTEPRCERPRDINVLFFILGVVYFLLFSQFFFESYLKKKPVRTEHAKAKLQ